MAFLKRKGQGSNSGPHLPRKGLLDKKNPARAQLYMSYDVVNSKNYQEVEIDEEALSAPTPSRKQQEPEIIPERVVTDIPAPEPTKLKGLRVFGDESESEIPPEKEWRVVREHLLREGRLDMKSAKTLINRARTHLRTLPNLLTLDAPLVICGDVHGQFFDLCNMLEHIGDPSGHKYLFLGDYVDRGDFSTEVCFLLFSIMLSFPDSFFMLRGNHESRLLTTNFNFKMECYCKYSVEIYECFMECFDALPLAAVIHNQNENLTYFACHGGISPSMVRVSDIAKIDREIEPPEDGLLCDLLWADPIPEHETSEMTNTQLESWKKVEYEYNETRGCSVRFGYAAVNRFLKRNKIAAVIRAHEVKREGFEENFFKHPDLDLAPVITVFSAPNYCDMYENKASYLQIGLQGERRFGQILWTSHPYWLPQFEDAISFSLPFLMDCMNNIYLNMLEYLGVEENQVSSLKTGYAAVSKQRTIKQQRLQLIKRLLADGKDPFKRACTVDKTNEMRPKAGDGQSGRPSLQRASSTIW